MTEIIIGNTVIPYTVRTSQRSKKLTINITPNDMEVVVPESTSEDKIISFVKRKRNWIYEKREELLETALKQENESLVHYRTGAKIIYRGRRVKLYIERSNLDSISIRYQNGFYIQVPVTLENEYNDQAIELALTDWMKDRVRQDCEIFSRKYGKLLELKPKGIRIKEQKHLWGSCGHDGILNFNWRLVNAPKQVLEYVVAHEVCHLKYRNHSDEFWGLLRSEFGEIEICRKWLEKSSDIKLKLDKRNIKTVSFSRKNLTKATEFYNTQEKMYKNNSAIDIVLVSAESIKDLKKAYPNYFSDTTEFGKILKRVYKNNLSNQ